MAIGTGTALLLGGSAIGSALIGGSAAQNAANTNVEAANQAAQIQQQQFQQGLQLSQPYIDAGQQALGGLQSLATPQGQMQALNQYTGSDLYQQQLASGSENVLRNQSATGALRTGQADFALGSLPLQMQQQYLNSQQGRLMGLAGMGAQATGQAFGGYQNLGTNLGNTAQQAGAYQAQAGAAMPMAFAGGLSDLGGLGLYGAMGGFGGGGAPGAGSGFSYNYGAQI